MIASTTNEGFDEANADRDSPDQAPNQTTSHHHQSRFSRYLRFARNRQGQTGQPTTSSPSSGIADEVFGGPASGRLWGSRDNTLDDPTDPPMPIAPQHRS